MMPKYEWNWRHLTGPGLILIAALIATGPLIVRGPSCGTDYPFHFGSWYDAQSSWRQGIPYPHWMFGANHGAGEPRFVFYPPLTWMLGAALGLVLPWTLVPAAFTFLVLAASGLATRALARQALPGGASTLAGCAAMFFGYPLFCLYAVSTEAEAAIGIWIPLLLLFALRERDPSPSESPRSVWRLAFDTSAVPLALAVAGVWLSSAPGGVMASYLLAAVALAVALLKRSWAPMVRAFFAVALGMSLAAAYLIPAAWEQRWVDITQAINDPFMTIENNWLFGLHSKALPTGHNIAQDSVGNWHHKFLIRVSFLMAVMIAVAVGSLLVSWIRNKPPFKTEFSATQSSGDRSKNYSWWIPLFLISGAVVFLNLPISLPLWDSIPKLRFLQFPSRGLAILEAPMAIFFALAIWPSRPRQRVYIMAACSILFVAISVFTGRYLFNRCDAVYQEPREPHALEKALGPRGEGVNGRPEYTSPRGVNKPVAIGLPDACLVKDPSVVLGKTADGVYSVWKADQDSCTATFSAIANTGKARTEHLRVTAFTAHPGYLILRLRNYPAWRVTVNGRTIHEMPWRDDGLMAAPVPRGTVDLAVDWVATRDVLVGRWLSGLAVLLLIGLWLLERKLSRSSITIKARPADTES